MLAKFFQTYSRRRWAYAIGEIVAISLAAFCGLTLWSGDGHEIGARATSACLLILSMLVFVGIVIERQRDPKV
jgi:hypothetical protein